MFLLSNRAILGIHVSFQGCIWKFPMILLVRLAQLATGVQVDTAGRAGERTLLWLGWLPEDLRQWKKMMVQ